MVGAHGLFDAISRHVVSKGSHQPLKFTPRNRGQTGALQMLDFTVGF